MFAQLCVEDLALDVKLKDMKYIQSQLRCVLADNNDFCDPFGLKLKRKLFFCWIIQCYSDKWAHLFISFNADIRQVINRPFP